MGTHSALCYNILHAGHRLSVWLLVWCGMEGGDASHGGCVLHLWCRAGPSEGLRGDGHWLGCEATSYVLPSWLYPLEGGSFWCGYDRGLWWGKRALLHIRW